MKGEGIIKGWSDTIKFLNFAGTLFWFGSLEQLFSYSFVKQKNLIVSAARRSRDIKIPLCLSASVCKSVI